MHLQLHVLCRTLAAVLIAPSALGAQRSVSANDPDGLLAAFAQHQVLARRSPLGSVRWQFLGPTNISGRANDIAVADSPTGRRVLIAYSFGGIWASDTTGHSPEPLFTSGADMSIHAIAVASSAPHIVWAGTDAGLYRSTDGGRSWSPRGLAGARTIWRIVVDPENANVVYAAAQGPAFEDSEFGGLFKTTNGGRSWRRVLNRGPRVGVTDIVLDPRDARTIYATTYQKLYTLGSLPVSAQPPDSHPNSVWKSTNRGESWTEVAAGLPPARFRGRVGLDVARSSPNVLYAVVDSYEPSRPVRSGELTPINTPVSAVFSDHLVFRSDDAGASWRRMSEPGIVQTWGGVMGPNDDFNQIRVDPQDPNTVYALGVWLHLSRDGGQTWTTLRGGQGFHGDLRRLWIDPADPMSLYLCTDGGAYLSGDRAETWKHILAPTTEVHTVSVDNASPFHVYASVQDFHSFRRSIPVSPRHDELQPEPFEEAPGGEHTPHVFPKNNSNTLITNAANLLSSLYRIDLTDTTARGRVRVQPQRAQADSPFRTSLVLPLVASTHDTATLYVGFQFVLRSRDLGDHWERISADLTDNDLSIPFEPRRAFQVISALAESPLEAGTLYVGTDDGHLWLTRDDGNTWVELTAHLPTQKQIASIAVSPHEPGTVYVTQASRGMPQWMQVAVTPALVYRSKDYGKTFESIATNLPKAEAYVIQESRDVPGLLFLGTRLGAYVSSDKGRRWDVLGGNLPTVPVRDIAIHPRDHMLIVATWGRGVWAVDESELRNALAR